MSNPSLEAKLNELVKELGGVGTTQHKKLISAAREVQNGHNKLKKSVDRLQESLDYLRVCIKYQIFDLEATRRENEHLKKLLDEKNS